MRTYTIHIEVPEHLTSLEDSHLAALWHAAQANSAPFGDREACEIADRIGWEIIRRFCRGVDPELYHHQGRQHYWDALRQFAKWDSEEGRWRLDPERVKKATGQDGAP